MMTRQHGFNIIEMMIGLTIGLFGLLAVTQVFISFNQQRNTSTQALEAQSNGTMALFLMERDLAQAGYGLMALSDCPNIQWYWNPPSCATCTPGVQSALTTAPIIITPGATVAISDRVQIQYAKSDSGSPGSLVTEDQAAYTDNFKLASVAGFNVGDMVVADVYVAGTHYCTMNRVTKINDDTVADPNKFTLEHDTSTAELSDYNPSTAPSTNGWKPAKINTMLANVGTYISKNYSVAGNSLQMAQFPGNTNDIAADGIVLMKAQYGKDSNLDGAVDVWNTSAVTDYKTMIAVRVGVIARSPLLEKDEVDAPTSLVVLPEIYDGTGTLIGPEVRYTVPVGEARHYRYKPYYTVVPIRNVIWSQ